jgi:hypothetical protein
VVACRSVRGDGTWRRWLVRPGRILPIVRVGAELEWSRFLVEGPGGRDVFRLAEHLGLAVYEIPDDWNQLVTRTAHPGVAWFIFPDYRRAHTVYVHDVRWLLQHWPVPEGPPATFGERPLWEYGWPLAGRCLDRGPSLAAVIKDERQPPHGV